MGQYYKPCILTTDKEKIKEWAYSHTLGEGLKLMEHSYIGGNMTSLIETRLADNPQPLVWAGDYADDNLYERVESEGSEILYENMPDTSNVDKYSEEYYNLVDSVLSPQKLGGDWKYIINHDKGEYINKDKVPAGKWGSTIHPLPLMTCEGNGRGGGDFRGNGKGLIGTWARDNISISKEVPSEFKEIIFDLSE